MSTAHTRLPIPRGYSELPPAIAADLLASGASPFIYHLLPGYPARPPTGNVFGFGSGRVPSVANAPAAPAPSSGFAGFAVATAPAPAAPAPASIFDTPPGLPARFPSKPNFAFSGKPAIGALPGAAARPSAFVSGAATASTARAPTTVLSVAPAPAAQAPTSVFGVAPAPAAKAPSSVLGVAPAPAAQAPTSVFGVAPAPAAKAPAPMAEHQPIPFTQTQNRPRLPEEKRNPFLGELPENVSIVKFQTLARKEREIVIGSINLPTSGNSHTFILRRYDTGAISLTSMFQAAFPGAAGNAKRSEMAWVRSNFDTRGMNGGRESPEHVRLPGQWVSPDLAKTLAPAYKLADLITVISRAQPEPATVYPMGPPSRAIRAGRPVPTPTTPSVAELAANPSPVQIEAANDHLPITLEATTTVTGPAGASIDVERQIAESKQLVANATRQLELANAAARDLEIQGVAPPANMRGQKRKVEDADEGEAALPANKRKVKAATGGKAGRKIAWGAAMFGLGLSAVFIPQIASQVPAFASQFF